MAVDKKLSYPLKTEFTGTYWKSANDFPGAKVVKVRRQR